MRAISSESRARSNRNGARDDLGIRIDNDKTASRLRLTRDCRGVEFFQRIGLGFAALTKRKRTPAAATSNRAPAEPSSAQVWEWFCTTVPHDPARARQLHTHANPGPGGDPTRAVQGERSSPQLIADQRQQRERMAMLARPNRVPRAIAASISDDITVKPTPS